MIQGYFSIDRVVMTKEEKVLFDKSMHDRTIHWRKIKSLTKELFQAVISNEENITLLLEELKDRNPRILGLWNLNGLAYGITRIIDEQGNETLSGGAKYQYQKNITELYLDDINEYDKDGNIIKIIGKLHHTFAGFETPKDFH